MTTRRYQRPANRLILDFDPVTWDALKKCAPGAMERTAYQLIQAGLGVVSTVIADAPVPDPPPDEMKFTIFSALR